MKVPDLCFKIPGLVLLSALILAAQPIPNPMQQPAATPPAAGAVPIFHITVVSRTVPAVNYHHRTGTTHIDFRGTELMPAARGEAKVDSPRNSGPNI
jgi:hypothetical protein